MGRGKHRKPATYEDLEQLPVGWVGEIVDDALYASPRPAYGHLRVSSRLTSLLAHPFELSREGPGSWWFLVEPELHLARDVVVPDVAGWRRERLPEPPDPELPWFSTAPDWLCEVLSPSTRSLDRVRKMPLYFREGVANLWVIDPVRQSLEVYRRGATSWVRSQLFTGSVTVSAEPFKSLPLDLGLLWTPRMGSTVQPG
ncbi:Uma2 family endonuclease [Myxococcus vastator]|uniref:Uma2 family endonuclease n=1 Tax=Myxococcus vastator TaxID=2709664 RepID=UPI0013D87415|nr:Uma2 family endonuclease [Myxococcus vastator]